MSNYKQSTMTLETLAELINNNHDTLQARYTELETTINTKIEQINESIGAKINELFLAVDGKFKAVEQILCTTNLRIDEIQRDSVADGIMIFGIPAMAKENVLTIFSSIYSTIGLQWDNRILQDIFRLPGASIDRPIVVKFLSQLLKKEFLQALKSFGELTHKNIGLQGNSTVYINHCLIKEDRLIFKHARILYKSHKIAAVFIMRGSIFIKQFDHSRPLRVTHMDQLNIISSEASMN